MGSALLHLVCRWDATFCSNKQKKQLSPFWSKISETIGGTIWSTSSIRYWAVWIAEFYKMSNASIDWISGVWGFFSFPLFLELSGYEQRYDQEERWQQERKMSWSPQFVIQFPALLWNTKDMTAGFAFLPGSAVLCRTPWPHTVTPAEQLQMIASACEKPADTQRFLFWFLFSDCKHPIDSATEKNVCISKCDYSSFYACY